MPVDLVVVNADIPDLALERTTCRHGRRRVTLELLRERRGALPVGDDAPVDCEEDLTARPPPEEEVPPSVRDQILPRSAHQFTRRRLADILAVHQLAPVQCEHHAVRDTTRPEQDRLALRPRARPQPPNDGERRPRQLRPVVHDVAACTRPAVIELIRRGDLQRLGGRQPDLAVSLHRRAQVAREAAAGRRPVGRAVRFAGAVAQKVARVVAKRDYRLHLQVGRAHGCTELLPPRARHRVEVARVDDLAGHHEALLHDLVGKTHVAVHIVNSVVPAARLVHEVRDVPHAPRRVPLLAQEGRRRGARALPERRLRGGQQVDRAVFHVPEVLLDELLVAVLELRP
mmetsp:Transcript_91933/g.281305  ORF Transcript_91933/g.281305 Transcript_91933/m.281305 type:complete len:343 (+) Transcript_91933:62-1090(+)